MCAADRRAIKQAGRGGLGTVLRDKKIKAIVCRYTGMKADSNNPADLKRIRPYGQRINKEIAQFDDVQNRMRKVGTAHLVEIMDDYDLLPVHNFKFGSHPDTPKINSQVWEATFTQGIPDSCFYGCTMACSKGVDGFTLKTGPFAGQCVTVDGPEYETVAGCGSNLGIFEPDPIIELNFYCDAYGIDSISFGTLTAFVMECYEAGILDLEKTGGLELRFGNADAAIELLHRMARGEGFGLVAGMGVRAMKAYFAEHYGADPQFLQDIGMENKGMEYSEYMTKESLAQQGGYGMTNKGAQHDEAWLIFMDMVNNQIPTFEDKAEALHYFPMWRTWFGLNGLCKLPWNDIEPENNALTDEPAKVPEHVENYVNLFSGITGVEATKEDLITMSERVYNFQRVFNLRMGSGKRQHDAIPYRSAGPVTVEEYESRVERYDKQLREKVGIDPTGMTTPEKVAALRRLPRSPVREPDRRGLSAPRLDARRRADARDAAQAGDRLPGGGGGREGIWQWVKCQDNVAMKAGVDMPKTEYPEGGEVAGLDDYVALIKTIQADWQTERKDHLTHVLWFRGQDDDWPLLPKVLRTVKDPDTGEGASLQRVRYPRHVHHVIQKLHR